MKNRIGIVGGGQLGKMLALSAKSMGFYVAVTDPTPNSPAGQVADKQIVADYNDEGAIRKLAKQSDFLTFEIELANASLLNELTEQGVQINPSAKTLTIIKDKLKQKKFLNNARIPTARFISVRTQKDIRNAAKKFDYPIVLKARFDAYDGRGNALIKSESDIKNAMKKLAGRKLYIEQWVNFKKELAVMVARSITGDIAVYPVVETIHKNNICHTVIAPASVSRLIQKKAQKLAEKTMHHLHGAGVFGIEMFLTKDNVVLVNEIAPRVHNSGHYTIEACATSQFEQHIRAITGLPLGNTEMIVPAAVMVNILGDRMGNAQVEGLHNAINIPHVSVHIYSKKETKPERKMGHITVFDTTTDKALQKALRARKYVTI